MVNPALPAACSASLARYLRPSLFKALCDPNRLTLVGRLAAAPEPLSVSDAADCCGVHISGVSRHLAMLRDAGVVIASKRGREVVYRLDHDALVATLRGLADAIQACCVNDGDCEPSQVPATTGEETDS